MQVKVNPTSNPPPPLNTGIGRTKGRSRESKLMLLLLGQYFHSNVVALPRLRVKTYVNFSKNFKASDIEGE